jgi:phosphoglucomutase
MSAISPFAGHHLPVEQLVNLSALEDAYFSTQPDVSLVEQRVSFGTSGHRGSAFNASFNEDHVLAITQAICDFRQAHNITGPIFLGIDTHALSEPAQASALEVLAANNVTVMIAANGEYTPTPVISHAILTYNVGRTAHLADGILLTPSHNPPDNGGYKYNPTNGGPADSDVTNWIQDRANALLENKLADVKRVPLQQALAASTTHEFDYINHYVSDLTSVIDIDSIVRSGINIGVDPLGGAGLGFWEAIGNRYGINLTVINSAIDKQFAFMTADWDGKIRMDPSSAYTMQPLLTVKDRFDVAFACDTDHDRHGIVTPSGGLLAPNHYLAVAIDYLYRHRPHWSASAAIGKTVVSSALIDRVAHQLGRSLYEVPVGFKWFASGLFDGSLGFGGEESAGASFLRRDGRVWTTDKDGLIPSLLAAEMTATTGNNPTLRHRELIRSLGESVDRRIDAPATREQKQALSRLDNSKITSTSLAGESITRILTKAPGNNASIGGIKVETKNGWFAARPSGTEDIYKIYAESFKDDAHLARLIDEAQSIVNQAISS